MIDLGTLGTRFTSSTATAINSLGQIVGTSYLAKVTQTGQQGHAFVWRRGVMTDLGTLGAGYATSEAVALNSHGDVVGSSRSQMGLRVRLCGRAENPCALSGIRVRDSRRDQRSRPGDRLSRSAGGRGRARIRLGNGTLTDLGTLGGAESDSAAINARNQIVGVSNTRRGARHPVLWTMTQS